jgi:hypothetical protein
VRDGDEAEAREGEVGAPGVEAPASRAEVVVVAVVVGAEPGVGWAEGSEGGVAPASGDAAIGDEDGDEDEDEDGDAPDGGGSLPWEGGMVRLGPGSDGT